MTNPVPTHAPKTDTPATQIPDNGIMKDGDYISKEPSDMSNEELEQLSNLPGSRYPISMVRGLRVAIERLRELESTLAAERASRLQAEDVIAKARCIRHWHDTGRNGEGMVVSAEAVRDLWESLAKLDAAKPSVSPEQEKP